MSSNVCGNCGNFKPERGAKFFDCTKAQHAGLKYGMQVRADSRACDAFVPVKGAVAQEAKPAGGGAPGGTRQETAKLCPWVKIALLVVLVIAVILLSWGIVTCLLGGGIAGPTATPGPTSSPAATGPQPTGGGTPAVTGVGGPTPRPTPTPVPEFQVGGWARSGGVMVAVLNPIRRVDWPQLRGGYPAPPGFVYVAFDVSIYNGSDASFFMSKAQIILVDSERAQYLASGGMGITGDGGTVAPRETDYGTIVFTVPNVAHGFKVYVAFDRAGTVWASWPLSF